MLAGSELTERLVDLARAVVGHLPGGLAVVSVAVGIFFAGISGSGAADTAALGAILIPTMVKDGYDRGFSAALVAADGAIGIIIPPSIGLIIYGVVANASIGKLFIAGIIPGVVVGACLAAASLMMARLRGWGRQSADEGSLPESEGCLSARSGPDAPVVERVQTSPRRHLLDVVVALRRAVWGLLAPLIILGGIYGGVFTPTESAAVVVVYALFVGTVVYRDLTFVRLVRVLVAAARTTGVVMFILATATLFALLLNTQGIAATITSSLVNSGFGTVLTLLVIDVVLVVAGAFLDVIGTYYIMVPILLPVVTALGIDPVHFGVITTVALAISLVLPPVGINLYVASAIANVTVGRIVRALAPVLLAELVALALITFIPSLSLGLPNLLGVN